MKKEIENKEPTMKSNMKNADDLIVKSEQERLGKIMPEIPVIKEEIKEEKEPLLEEESSASQSKSLQEETKEDTTEKEEEEHSKEELEEPEIESKSQEPSDHNDDNEVDEYGTKVGKKKLYTEEEVQGIIRKRLKLQHEPTDQQSLQQATKDFKPDAESEESWESQLEGFIENTLQKRAQKQADHEWRQQEERSQAEFEVKFSEGMGKYKDFNSVVGNKPITNAMMLATRGMKDPAAFLYAACKQQSKELERISSIRDSMAQAVEMGRLEERMKKARIIPSSPKPASRISGDVSSDMPEISIDARIAQHAKTKIMR